jgi:hypothetical protein
MEDQYVTLTDVAKKQGIAPGSKRNFATINLPGKAPKNLTYDEYTNYFLRGPKKDTKLAGFDKGGKKNKNTIEYNTDDYNKAYDEGTITRYNPNTGVFQAQDFPIMDITASAKDVGAERVRKYRDKFAKDYMEPAARVLAETNPASALAMAGYDIYDEASKGNYGAAALYGGAEALPWGLRYLAKPAAKLAKRFKQTIGKGEKTTDMSHLYGDDFFTPRENKSTYKKGSNVIVTPKLPKDDIYDIDKINLPLYVTTKGNLYGSAWNPFTYIKGNKAKKQINELLKKREGYKDTIDTVYDTWEDAAKEVDDLLRINHMRKQKVKGIKEAKDKTHELDSIFKIDNTSKKDFMKRFPGYGSFLTNKNLLYLLEKDNFIESVFDPKLVDEFIERNTKSVRGIKNAPDQETAIEWLTKIGDESANNRSLINLGPSLYTSNSKELMKNFSRGYDTSGNYAGNIRINLGLDKISDPVAKIREYEKSVRRGSDIVKIPTEKFPEGRNMTIIDAARLGQQEKLKEMGIKAIDKAYGGISQAERGIIDESIVQLENLLDMSHAGTTKPIGQGGMWGGNTKASEDLFDYIDNIQVTEKLFQTKPEAIAWKKKYKKVLEDLNNSYDQLNLSYNKRNMKKNEAEGIKGINEQRIIDLKQAKKNLEDNISNKLFKLKVQSGAAVSVVGSLEAAGLGPTDWGEAYERSASRRMKTRTQWASLSPQEKKSKRKEWAAAREKNKN